MTIVTALVGQQSIVVASDSRTTNQDGSISDNAVKIRRVGFKSPTFPDLHNTVLVAAAGHDDLSSRAVDILEDLAWDTELRDYRTVADLMQQAVKLLKDRIREQFVGTPEQLQQHYRDYHFELLAAHYHAGKPYVFTLDFELGIARPHLNSHLVAIGCGRLLAEFCLHGMSIAEMPNWEAFATAAYAVEQVKKFDGRCGGKLQMGMCWWQAEGGTFALMNLPGLNDAIAAEAVAVANEIHGRWKDQTKDIIQRVNEKIKAAMLADVRGREV